jgi:predicted dehydrogenase
VRDRTIYSLTTLTDLFGPVRQVTAISNLRLPVRHIDGRWVHCAVDDNTLIMLEFVSGVLALATGNYCHEGRLLPAGFIGVFGSDGAMETSSVDPSTWYPLRIEVQTRRSESSDEGLRRRELECALECILGLNEVHARLPEAQVYADIMHLVDCVLEEKTPLSHPSQARHVVEIVERAYDASRTGQTQFMTTTF